MESPWPENLPTDRKKAIEELIQGREFTNQLQILLSSKPLGADWSLPAEDLIAKIWRSFDESLSILNCSDSDEVSQIPANTRVSSPIWDGRKSEDSGESSKSSALKDRRGCYKRRKTSDTWTRLTQSLMDDGHAWRKYGQKVILNANHPRNYYRCTHKIDQGCQATKQVQKTEDDPPMYRTTYNGHHTCKTFLKSSEMILDSNPRESSFLLSFESNTPVNKQDDPFFSSSSFHLIKQENMEEVPISHDLTHNPSSSSDYLLSPELTTFESSGPDHSGVYSCTASTHSFDMDMMVGSVDFDDVLHFEF